MGGQLAAGKFITSMIGDADAEGGKIYRSWCLWLRITRTRQMRSLKRWSANGKQRWPQYKGVSRPCLTHNSAPLFAPTTTRHISLENCSGEFLIKTPKHFQESLWWSSYTLSLREYYKLSLSNALSVHFKTVLFGFLLYFYQRNGAFFLFSGFLISTWAAWLTCLATTWIRVSTRGGGRSLTSSSHGLSDLCVFN